MALHDILVHLDDVDALDGFLPAVLALAQARGVRAVTLAAVAAVRAPVTGASLTLSLMRAREREALDLLDLMRERAVPAAAACRVEWRSAAVPDPTPLLADWGVRSDLLVLREPLTRPGPLGGVDVGEVVLSAGRPVLVVPRATTRLRFDRVLIGFKPTREGRLALAAAAPLLAGGGHAMVVAVGDGVTHRQLADAAAYLEGRGVPVDTRRLDEETDRDAGRVLLQVAAEEGADLLVLGAYGRGRGREFVFGGATRTVLSQARLPCLMVH